MPSVHCSDWESLLNKFDFFENVILSVQYSSKNVAFRAWIIVIASVTIVLAWLKKGRYVDDLACLATWQDPRIHASSLPMDPGIPGIFQVVPGHGCSWILESYVALQWAVRATYLYRQLQNKRHMCVPSLLQEWCVSTSLNYAHMVYLSHMGCGWLKGMLKLYH